MHEIQVTPVKVTDVFAAAEVIVVSQLVHCALPLKENKENSSTNSTTDILFVLNELVK